MNEIIRIQVGPIRKNRAQIRTTHNVGKLAELTLQILTRGFDADRPLLVRPYDGENGYQYENIRGHRRRMCLMMAQRLHEQGKSEWTVEEVRDEWLGFLIQHDGDVDRETTTVAASLVERATETLVKRYGVTEAPAVIFEGEAQQATLALWSDSFGAEEPDPMGVAVSLHTGIMEQGITMETAAAQMGQTIQYVRRHLALGQVDSRLSTRIVDDGLSLTIASVVAGIKHHTKRQALTSFILDLPPHSVTLAKVESVARSLQDMRLEMPLQFPNQTRRNVARAFLNLWHEKLEEDEVKAYKAACVVAYPRAVLKAPWEDPTAAQDWLQALGLHVSGNWMGALVPYLKAVSCEMCPVADLPGDLLDDEPRLPCRTAGVQVERCLMGMTPDDPFQVRVPMSWANHPGVEGSGGQYVATSFADLKRAWEAQRDWEAQQARNKASGERTEKKRQEVIKKREKHAKKKKSAPDPVEDDGPSPIELMRAKIQMYIALHPTMDGSGHFMSTPCATCQHKLDGSPTSDPSVPACSWASHQRTIRFYKMAATNGSNFAPVPVCDQYAPEAPWREILPAYPDPPESVAREWLLRQVRLLAADRKARSNKYKPFQWLTGRPMSKSANYNDWFLEQLDQQQGDLSDAQVFTLFVLAHGEWKRAEGFGGDGIFDIPVGKNMAMIPVTAERWKFEETA